MCVYLGHVVPLPWCTYACVWELVWVYVLVIWEPASWSPLPFTCLFLSVSKHNKTLVCKAQNRDPFWCIQGACSCHWNSGLIPIHCFSDCTRRIWETKNYGLVFVSDEGLSLVQLLIAIFPLSCCPGSLIATKAQKYGTASWWCDKERMRGITISKSLWALWALWAQGGMKQQCKSIDNLHAPAWVLKENACFSIKPN